MLISKFLSLLVCSGTLKAPSFQLSSSLLHATPLGSVPGRGGTGSLTATPSDPPTMDGFGAGHPGLGTLPGKKFNEKLEPAKELTR